jgi:hypothetical protein
VRVRAACAAGEPDLAVAALDIVERTEHLAVLRESQGRLSDAVRTLVGDQAPGPHRSRPALARSWAFMRASWTWRSPLVRRRRTSSSTSTKGR